MNATRFSSLLLLSAFFAACTGDPSSADAPTSAPDISADAIDTTMQSSVNARVDSAGSVRDMPENLRPTDYAVPEQKVPTTPTE